MPDLGLSDRPAAALVLLAASALLAGLARGFSGFGAALVFVPLGSAAVGPAVAVPLLLLVDAVATAGLVPGAWSRADRREVGVMALGALAGVPVGTFVLARSDPVLLRWGIVATILALLAFLVSGWRYRGRPAPPLTVAVGGLAGLLSGAAQVGGPPVVAYWLAGDAPAPAVRANVVLYFAVSTVLTGASYLWAGLLTAPVLGLALAAGPVYALGVHLGARLFGLASEEVFRKACYALIAAAALLGMPALDGLTR